MPVPVENDKNIAEALQNHVRLTGLEPVWASTLAVQGESLSKIFRDLRPIKKYAAPLSKLEKLFDEQHAIGSPFFLVLIQ